jgi:hypothetical protein
MAGYIKKIAVIKDMQGGFTLDGCPLSGVVKAEVYAGFLKVELSLINLAPVLDGRYVYGISDGNNLVIFENEVFEGEVDFNLKRGFACLICYFKEAAVPIGYAHCGRELDVYKDIREAIDAMEKMEKIEEREREKKYDDEAISEVNYYEHKVNTDGNAVCADKKEEEKGWKGKEDENDSGSFKEGGKGGADGNNGQNGHLKENSQTNQNPQSLPHSDGAIDDDEGGFKGFDLAGGTYYERIEGNLKKIFEFFSHETKLEMVMEESHWVRITLNTEGYLVFGVVYDGGKPKYIGYGLHTSDGPNRPLKSFGKKGTYVPVEDGGFWILFQDAQTGVSVKIDRV